MKQRKHNKDVTKKTIGSFHTTHVGELLVPCSIHLIHLGLDPSDLTSTKAVAELF